MVRYVMAEHTHQGRGQGVMHELRLDMLTSLKVI